MICNTENIVIPYTLEAEGSLKLLFLSSSKIEKEKTSGVQIPQGPRTPAKNAFCPICHLPQEYQGPRWCNNAVVIIKIMLSLNMKKTDFWCKRSILNTALGEKNIRIAICIETKCPSNPEFCGKQQKLRKQANKKQQGNIVWYLSILLSDNSSSNYFLNLMRFKSLLNTYAGFPWHTNFPCAHPFQGVLEVCSQFPEKPSPYCFELVSY